MKKFLFQWRIIALAMCLVVASAYSTATYAQQLSSGSIQGVVKDQQGNALSHAQIAVLNLAQSKWTAITDVSGNFSIKGLPPGTYSLQVSSTGFATYQEPGITIANDKPVQVSISLSLASVSEEVKVEAEADSSLASQLSPVKSLLDAASARTEITSQYISNFTSSVTDFADITQAAPGTVSWSTNGVGLGQAKIYFRGFKDADYTMTWDGIPFQDSNDPTHHSWAYVPAPAIGYVDFDRSPGTASDIGPSNYGGSIHMFSPKLPDGSSMRISETRGSFNTNQVLGEFYSGLFGGANPKANFWFEGHHMTSDGYQTYNYQVRSAGTAKFTYKFSDKTYLSLIGTVVLVDSNTPDSDPTRAQIAQYGDNFLLQNNEFNADGSYNALYYRYYFYHIPTNFEIIDFTKDFGHGWRIESKPYTYSYSNHQHLQKDQSSSTATVSSKSAINKMNQYNRGGQITTASWASRYGVFRAGAWYEYTTTNRYQIKSDPRTWVDIPTISGINFHENFVTKSVQPFAEYQLVAIPKWTITAGLKDAYYNMWLKQYADNGKKIGPLTCSTSDTPQSCPASTTHDAGYNSWLPSFEANYRIRDNWSVYGQYGRGSIIPYSSVFDVTGAQVEVTPPPTVATTYQGGTVIKLNRVSMDADAYHIHFVNQYSSYTDKQSDFTYYYATPDSNTNGFEAEGNIAFGGGVALFLNGTVGAAKYEAADAQPATSTSPATDASPSAWVANAPHDTESVGLTYQKKNGLDLGFFNKRVGSRWDDDGSYHQNVAYSPFWMSNLFFNYTVRNGSRFSNSKIKFSVNNLFDNHDVVGISPNNDVTGSLVPYTPDPQDQLLLLPARSFMISFQLGFSPRER